MKKLVLTFLTPLLFGVTVFAQKTVNDPNAEKREVGSFHGINVATGIHLILSQGNSEEVAVSAAKTEHRDKIVTKVENGVLKIHYETKLGSINRKNETKDLKAYVSIKSLDKLHVNTGANVEITGILVSNSLELEANTGGLVKGEVNIKNFKVNQNTGSKITISGKADYLEVDGDTGSKFVGEALVANTCNINVSTGAGVYISVEKELNVKANTGGYIKYKGNAGIKEIITNTGGKISKI